MALRILIRPDVVRLDIVMPYMNGIDAAREILRGYVLKRNLSEELIDAIRRIAAGGRYLSPSVSDTVIGDFLHEKKAPGALQPLSSRERHVLHGLTPLE